MGTRVPGKWRCKLLPGKAVRGCETMLEPMPCLRNNGVPSLPPGSRLLASLYSGLSSPEIPPQTHHSSHSEPLLFPEQLFCPLHMLLLLPKTFFLFPYLFPSQILLILKDLALDVSCNLLQEAHQIDPSQLGQELLLEKISTITMTTDL